MVALQVFAVLWACVCVWQDVDNLARNAHVELNIGTIGLARDRGGKQPGYVGVIGVKPDAAADKAGIVAGDQIHYDYPGDFTRHFMAGDEIGVSIDHQGVRRHAVLTADAKYAPGPLTWSFLTDDQGNAAATLVMALFAGFIALRSRGKLTTILLALGLMTYGLSTYVPEHSFSNRAVYIPALVAGFINLGSIPFLFHAFALNFYKDTIASPRRWEYGLLMVYGAVMAVLTAVFGHYNLTGTSLPVLGTGLGGLTVVSMFGFAAAFVYLFLGWRRSRQDIKQRYAILLLAASAIIVAQAMTLIATIYPFGADIGRFLTTAQSLLAGVIAPPLFAYAIFRHKVLDLGFALNRTVVYAIISFVILLAFGLAEWGIEKLMPHDWREHVEANAFVSAAIALCIFLVFHRIRDFVEHHIEKLFFRQWHHKEAELKRFVHEARFILKRDPIIIAYVAAVRRFCDGAETALYLADDEGVYRRVEGSLTGQPDILDADNPFLVTLRADLTVFEPGAPANALALVLPMIHRTEVIGATLVGRKLNGFGYRPDEKEVLAWAAHQIGLDLHALEVERLQAANSALTAANSVLNAKYSDLRDMTHNLLQKA